MSNAVPPPQPPRKDNTTTCLIIGCAVFLIAAVAIAGIVALGGYFVFNAATEMIASISSEERVSFPASPLSDEAFVELQGRYDAFVQAIETGAPAEPLRLSSDEVNALIQRGLAGPAMADSVYVSIVDNKIQAEFSLPIEQFLPLEQFRGRYINGKGALDVYTRNGQLFAHIVDVEIAGKPLPTEIAQPMAQENLMKDFASDARTRDVVARIASIEVADGAVYVQPVQSNGAP